MKSIIVLATILMLATPPAEARRGLLHKICNVAGAPLWVVGWTAACVGGAVGIPIMHGVDYFTQHPFVGDR
jgi:hypothetical protein